MVPQRLTQLPTVLRQRLLVEFTGLRQACPQGVFVSCTPRDPTLWTGVIFVRKGPYSPSILRFHISFPSTYPAHPPLITFSTDIFHPLVTPLTTYINTTSAQPESAVSAIDAERLPPGGFSLRDGFPGWFDQGASWVRKNVSIYEVLQYVRSTFDVTEVLDKIPLAATGNSGAWYAWRYHRVKQGIVYPSEEEEDDSLRGREDNDEMSIGSREVPSGSSAPVTSKRPGEWNWDNVWEVRVRKGTEGSLAEGVLFGRETGDNLIHFLNLDTDQYEAIRENIRKSLEVMV